MREEKIMSRFAGLYDRAYDRLAATAFNRLRRAVTGAQNGRSLRREADRSQSFFRSMSFKSSSRAVGAASAAGGSALLGARSIGSRILGVEKTESAEMKKASIIKYESDLVVVIHHPVKGKPEGRAEILRFPVHSFEVEGGADRKVDLASVDEFSIALAFEQARVYKNVIFYIPSGKDVPIARLLDLSRTEKRNFVMAFGVRVMGEEKTLRMISLESYAAKFAECAVSIGQTPPLLKVRVNMYAPDLLHGVRDEKRDSILLRKV